MSWRTLPLPLLMLTTALTPAEAARGLNGGGLRNPRLESQSRMVAGSTSAATSFRRRADSGDAFEISEEALRQVGGYLCCLAGNCQPDAALGAAWDRFHPWCDGLIRRYAAACRLRGADVDDCAQEVWVDLMQSLRSFRLDPARGSFNSWLYRIVHSKAVDMQRRQARRPAASLSEDVSQVVGVVADGPAAHSERREDCAVVRGALAELKRDASDVSYQVLHLRQLEGRSVHEVADVLGLTAEQVWAR
ncbi:MAG: RNA polymerase sigma factor, partial [Tepidisphaerales bacterium]